MAIRVLRRTPGTQWEVARERLLREAQSLQLSHPSVVQVRDFGEENDLLYVVTEVFTLAAVIYEMATGTRPFDAPTFPTLMGAMLKGQAADPRKFHPELPDEVAQALLVALSHEPEQRPPTPVALGASLFAKPR